MDTLAGRNREARDAAGELSPLPLTPFERFMLQDDRPDHPMTFYIEMALAGQLDPQVLREAVRTAVDRNPLLGARLAGDRDPSWIFQPRPEIRIDRTALNGAVVPPGGAVIDLAREPGVRVWWASENGQVKIWIQFHHACTDGQGARRFIVDLFTGYARLSGDDRPKFDHLDAARLRERGVYSPAGGVQRTGSWDKIRHTFDFLCRTPSPLAAPNADGRAPASRPPLLLWHAFQPEETLTIRRRTRDEEGTLNDVAIALLFRTLADWNRRHGAARDAQRLRILVPADLRGRADARLPSANRVGFAFLTRRIGDCGDHQGLLHSVREETTYVKQTLVALDFVECLGPLTRFPRALSAILRWSPCMATAVLTNLDDPSRRFLRRFPVQDGQGMAGNLRLQRIAAVPPIRPGTRAGFGLCAYGGQMTIGLNADASCFDVPAARELLDAYVHQWRRWYTTPLPGIRAADARWPRAA